MGAQNRQNTRFDWRSDLHLALQLSAVSAMALPAFAMIHLSVTEYFRIDFIENK